MAVWLCDRKMRPTFTDWRLLSSHTATTNSSDSLITTCDKDSAHRFHEMSMMACQYLQHLPLQNSSVRLPASPFLSGKFSRGCRRTPWGYCFRAADRLAEKEVLVPRHLMQGLHVSGIVGSKWDGFYIQVSRPAGLGSNSWAGSASVRGCLWACPPAAGLK